jgi:3-oxoadipate enol-lactonase
MIGHDKVGSGPLGVIVLNDWMCDTSTWDGARAYLDDDRFTWTFADLRGYGRSMGLDGEHTPRPCRHRRAGRPDHEA